MFYVYNKDDFYFKHIYNNDKIIIENVYGKDYIHDIVDDTPLFTMIRKHDLYLRAEEKQKPLYYTTIPFKLIHRIPDKYEYDLILNTIPESIRNFVRPAVVYEVDNDGDDILLIINRIHGALSSMTNDTSYDIYAGRHMRMHKYQYLMKIRSSFKLQEYTCKDENTPRVTDRIFKYNHVLGSLRYSYRVMAFDNAFYKKNRRLYSGEGYFKGTQFELFYVRDSYNYPM